MILTSKPFLRRTANFACNTGMTGIALGVAMMAVGLVGHMVIELFAVAFTSHEFNAWPHGGDAQGNGYIYEPAAPFMIDTLLPFGLGVALMGVVVLIAGGILSEAVK